MWTAMIELKSLMYQSRRKLKHWSPSIGMNSARGIVSSIHEGRTETSKMSMAAAAADSLLDGKLSVNIVKGGTQSYVEYLHADGKVESLILDYQPGTKYFTAYVTAEDVPEYSLFQMIFAAVCGNHSVLTALVDNCYLPSSVETELYNPVRSLAEKKQVTEQVLFQMCDFFYYGIGKYFSIKISSDRNLYQSMADRIVQVGMLERLPDTPNPSLIKVEKRKRTKTVRKKKTLYNEPLDAFFERCKKGEFLIDYAWSEKQKNAVVPLSYLSSFIPTEAFRRVLLSTWYQVKNNLEKMRQGVPYDEIMALNPINIKIMGKPGSGKTTVIEAVLASLGYPKGLINCKDRMEEDEIEGMNKFVNGVIHSIPTKAGEFHSIGGAILLEEFNLPDPGILMGSLGQALAYPFILKIDGYRECKRHPLTIYFATMNIGTNGSKPMNEALSSRFPEGHILEEVSKDEFVGILSGAGYDKNDCEAVYRIYRAIITYLQTNREDLVLSVTLRHCLSALEKMRIGFTGEQAVEMTFLSQLYSSDPEVAQNVKEALSSLGGIFE